MAGTMVGALTWAGPALADGCPTAPDHSEPLQGLYDQLLEVDGEMQARLVSNQMWQYWADAPDEASQEILDEGMKARAAWDFLRAIDRFDALIGYCPFYAEGYNQRGFVNYLRQDYEATLPDLERALDINPKHLGALSGRALTLLALGREVEGQKALRDALELNPWLTERYLLKPLPGQEL